MTLQGIGPVQRAMLLTGVVGAISASVDVASFAAAVMLVAVPVPLAAALSLVLSAIVNLLLQHLWLYRASTRLNGGVIVRYFVIATANWAVSSIVAQILISHGTPAVVARGITVIVLFTPIFFSLRLWVFRVRTSKPPHN